MKLIIAVVDVTFVITRFVGGLNALEILTFVREIDELIEVFV